MSIHDMGIAQFHDFIRQKALAVADEVRQPIVTDGRRMAVGVFDVLLQDPSNLKKLHDAAQEKFDEDPVAFFHKFVRPLLPEDTINPAADDGMDNSEAAIRRRLAALEEDMSNTIMPALPAPESYSADSE